MLRSNSRPRVRLAAAGLALSAGLAVASPALAASSGSAARAAPASSSPATSTFVVGDTDAVDTLNPFLGFTSQDYEVYGLIYDNLM
ncbi:MAG TPA: peptide ABC transporter substrate-binding protein, partial [Streptosporangiaceae bacterium]|nr:peptide ABC transporter substrate-binding protein [Streptosporangiaceae bacterium]